MIKTTKRNIYEKTVIIDYDMTEGTINGHYIPPGHRFIMVGYYGDSDDYAYIGEERINDETFVEAAKKLAEGGVNLAHWRAEYPTVAIDLKKDIILLCNYRRQCASFYLPPGVKAIWTDMSLAYQGVCKVDAAKFLVKHLQQKRKKKLS